MVFCHKCGAELHEDAYFCHKCGVRTRKGVEAGVPTTWVEVRDDFSKVGVKIEKAFAKAGKEIEKAFKTARESMKESMGEANVVCSHCGEKSNRGARFCYHCGKEL